MSLKWGTIVPLIGGLTLAGKRATGQDPNFLLTYTPFGENEKNVRAYFPNVPYHQLDTEDRGGFDVAANRDVDFVQALCPCAGLSLLSSGSPEQRAKQNYWMLETAKFMTGELRPRVFWGENAPGLYSNTGEHVRNELRQIGERNGYSFSVYATSTHFHGIPQTRKRTFYFFWRDGEAPVMEYYRKPVKNFTEYMREVPKDSIHHTADDIQAARDTLNTNPFIMFLQEKHDGKGIEKMREWLVRKDMKSFTLNTYLLLSEQFEECMDWLKQRGHDKHLRLAQKVWEKVTSKGGFWDGSFPMYRGDLMFATLISRTLYAIHPEEERVLTTREMMHLMGMPHDLPLVTGGLNHICQNVPVSTGADMTNEVIAYLRGERESSGARFTMQSNITQRIDHSESALLSF